jgi:hypothetical protein
MDAKLAREFDIAILAPPTLEAPTVAHKLLQRRRPLAVLMPADLFRHIAGAEGGQRLARWLALIPASYPALHSL